MNAGLKKGKWYVVSSNKGSIDENCWFIKFKEIDENVVYAKEYVTKSPHSLRYQSSMSRYNFGTLNYYNFTLLEDLSVIEEYLPLNHLDRKPKKKVYECW
jgi:hypothetical protein